MHAPNARTEITLSKDAVIVWPYKLVLGGQGGKGWWSSPFHPNATQSNHMDNNPGCPKDGCIFNIAEDPSEYLDLSAGLNPPWQPRICSRTLMGLLRGCGGESEHPIIVLSGGHPAAFCLC